MNHDLYESRSRLTEMFWERVSEGTPESCWEWRGAKLPAGYGFITESTKIDGHWRGRTVYAHRLSHEIHKGPIPKGYYVIHDCDNPSCVDPAHIRVGTPQDNVDDMHSKGRHPHPPARRLARTPGEALFLQRMAERDQRYRSN